MNNFRNSVLLTLMLGATLSVPASAETTKWGAMALDTQIAEKEPFWGTGAGDTEQEASDNAMKFCKEAGGKVCKALVTYEQCAAMAVDGKGKAGWGKSATKSGAEKQALEGCAKEGCSVVVSDCTNE